MDDGCCLRSLLECAGDLLASAGRRGGGCGENLIGLMANRTGSRNPPLGGIPGFRPWAVAASATGGSRDDDAIR